MDEAKQSGEERETEPLLAPSSLPQEPREFWTGLKGGLKIIWQGEAGLAVLAGMAPGAASPLPHCCRVRAGPGKGRERSGEGVGGGKR